MISFFDTVIILDACRYDYYAKYRRADAFWAPGRSTWESIPRLFPGKYPHVYVSANPYINSRNVYHPPGWKPTEHFYRIVDVWDFGWECIDGICTVPPWNVVEEALKWQRRGYRVVAHFMQPHAPYIGDTRLGFMDWSKEREEARTGRRLPGRKWIIENTELLRRAYEDNLRLVLRYVDKVVDGRTLIISDHGELLGETVAGTPRFGHPTDIDHELLHWVPIEVIV